MSTSQKLELFKMLVDTASCFKNELRTSFGAAPLEEFVGEIAMSSNKTNAENNRGGDDIEQDEQQDR